MSWDAWLQEVANRLNIEPDEVLAMCRTTPRELYEKGATVNEAADFLRLYC